ncbi:MAG TPA: radical SAM family heme chaperone HemW [Thermoanaerobaculia bacterium]|nr:radical SAM family heme chaperone HemW [Thermoanaerobaculia bacterium]
MSLGLYLHLPFCRVHCTYCPFAVSTDIRLQDRYATAMIREMESSAMQGVAVNSIFLGGGTPSRTSRENLSRIFGAVRAVFAILPDAEVSIEANPEDITEESLDFWSSLGVNRVSIGVQSFHDNELRPLGRVHGGDGARRAVALAVASGVRTSLDLILGLPGQTAESFAITLETAIASGVGHLSLYLLDLEEGTALHRHVGSGRTKLPEDDLTASLYLSAVDRLREAGLAQYEISNFARDEETCRHNLHYWRREEYLGFGMAAHSFVGARRFANSRDIRKYIETIEAGTHGPDFQEELGEAEVKRERIFLGLRQRVGLNYAELVSLCGEEGRQWVTRGLGEGWLRRAGDRIGFTPSGFLLSNDYISQLF